MDGTLDDVVSAEAVLRDSVRGAEPCNIDVELVSDRVAVDLVGCRLVRVTGACLVLFGGNRAVGVRVFRFGICLSHF